MKKQALLFFALSICAFGQGVRYDVPPILNSRAVLVPNANISLCPGTATITNSTCSPASTQAFTDITLTTPCATGSPVVLPQTSVCSGVADSLGNAGFWLAPGAYIYCINSPSITGKCYNLTVPIGTTTTGVTTPGIIYVTTHTDAAVQAALAQCGANGAGGGIVYLTDAATGAWPTLTTTMTIPGHCKLIIGGVSSASVPHGLQSSANPVVNMNCGSTADCGATLAGLSRGQSLLSATTSNAILVNMAANCNWCKIEDISLATNITAGTTSTAIQIQDNQREMVLRNITINPNGSCISYISGANGFNFIELDQIVCAPQGTAVGFNFNLSTLSGATLKLDNVFCNGNASTAVCFDFNAVEALMINSAANVDVIGVRTGNNPGPIQIINSQFQSDSTAGIQVNGTAGVIIDGTQFSADQLPIQVQASGSTFIRTPLTIGTVGANSIVYTSAATGLHTLANDFGLDKPPSITLGVSVNRIGQSSTAGLVGIAGGISGLAPGAANNGIGVWGDTGATLGTGTGKEMGVIGSTHAAGDIAGDRSYGGFFHGSAVNLNTTEVGVHAETSGGTGGHLVEWGPVGALKGFIDATGDFAFGNIWASPTAPTIAGAGCGGTAATIVAPNGTASFEVNTGTAPTSACTITMPAATTNWSCDASHVSATTTTNFIIQQTGAISTTSVVLTLFSDVAGATSYQANDTLRVKCMAN